MISTFDFQPVNVPTFFFNKNIEAEICDILKIFYKPEAEILKRIQFCVLKISKYNTIICFSF